MDPNHHVHPPRAHPSGTHDGRHEGQDVVYHSNGNSPIGNSNPTTHKKTTDYLSGPWLMVLVFIILLVVVISTAIAMVYFKRKHQMTKELGHLSGK